MDRTYAIIDKTHEPIIEDGAQVKGQFFVPSRGIVKYHSSVYFQSNVSMKRGLDVFDVTCIGPGCYICSFVNIGHNVRIGKNCFLATGCKILGNVTLGNNVYVGSNAVITQDLNVGSWVKVRAGEIVSKDIPSNTYYGKNGKMVPNLSSPQKTFGP